MTAAMHAAGRARGAVTIGVSVKTYFTHARARRWLARVAESMADESAIANGAVNLFIAPTYLQIPAALTAFAGTPVVVAAQDVSQFDAGAFTGEISAAELAELGVGMAEIGHAERRKLCAETDDVVAAKVAAALACGIRPLLCVGEAEVLEPEQAATQVVAQLRACLAGAPAGPVTVAYEPIWAIGAQEPAGVDHICPVSTAVRRALDQWPERVGSDVIYGGSAGPGLLTELGGAVDGLFLGRFAHDVDNLLTVLREAQILAESKR